MGTRRVLSLLSGGPSRGGLGPVRGVKGLKPNDFNGPSGGAGETRGENRYREENTGHGAPFSHTHITIPPDPPDPPAEASNGAASGRPPPRTPPGRDPAPGPSLEALFTAFDAGPGNPPWHAVLGWLRLIQA